MKRLNENEFASDYVNLRSLGLVRLLDGSIMFLVQVNGECYLLSNDSDLDGQRDGAESYYYPIIVKYYREEYVFSWCLDGTSMSKISNELISQGLDAVEGIYILNDAETNTFEVHQLLPKLPDMFKPIFTSSHYGDEQIYKGYNRYHALHDSVFNAPTKENKSNYKFGIELEVEFSESSKREEFTLLGSNWFYCERDGSLDDSTGCEIVTIPLLPCDAKSVKFWDVLTSKLNELGARSWKRSSCGLHVHVSKEIFGKNENEQSENLGKALYLYHEFLKDSQINCIVFGRERAYSDHLAKTKESSAVSALGSDSLKYKGIKDKVKNTLLNKSKETRYVDINLQNMDDIGTIEFRRGKGSICSARIVSIIQWCELICLYSKQVKWTNISLENFMEYAKNKVSGSTPLGCKISADL